MGTVLDQKCSSLSLLNSDSKIAKKKNKQNNNKSFIKDLIENKTKKCLNGNLNNRTKNAFLKPNTFPDKYNYSSRKKICEILSLNKGNPFISNKWSSAIKKSSSDVN